jgi:ribosome-binding factor A
VREVVADAIRDLKDPRIGFVTVTGAETSPDLRHAVVYYSALGSEEEQEASAEALQRARPRLQRALGDQTRLRYTPKLEFRIDESIDRGLRINELLAGLTDDESGAPGSDHTAETDTEGNTDAGS